MAANELVVKLEEAVQEAIALDAPLNERMAVIANAVRALSTTSPMRSSGWSSG